MGLFRGGIGLVLMILMDLLQTGTITATAIVVKTIVLCLFDIIRKFYKIY